MKKHNLLIFSLIISCSVNAQYQIDIGARQGGMGGTGVVLPCIWSSYHNQAGLADLKGLSAGIFYSAIFNIPDLRETAFAIAFPMNKFGTAGLNYTYSGNPASNFTKFGLAYAMRLSERILAGIQLDYFQHIQISYGRTGIPVGEIGIITEPVDDLYIGVHVFNPWRASYSDIEESLSSSIRMGAGYHFSKQFIFMFELEKELEQEVLYRAGAEYNIVGGLFLRSGVCVNPVKYSFGLGYELRGILMDVSYISHNILGYYMQFGLAYTINKSLTNNEMI